METKSITLIRIGEYEAGAWPHDIARQHPDAWIEVSDGFESEMLNILPPAYVPGGFYVTEANDHKDGDVWYSALLTIRNRHYLKSCPRAALRDGSALRELAQVVLS